MYTILHSTSGTTSAPMRHRALGVPSTREGSQRACGSCPNWTDSTDRSLSLFLMWRWWTGEVEFLTLAQRGSSLIPRAQSPFL